MDGSGVKYSGGKISLSLGSPGGGCSGAVYVDGQQCADRASLEQHQLALTEPMEELADFRKTLKEAEEKEAKELERMRGILESIKKAIKNSRTSTWT